MLAARVLRCDLGYVATSFIATAKSMAVPGYKQMLVESSLDDVVLTKAFTGLPTSMLTSAIRAAVLDPASLEEHVSPTEAARLYGGGSPEAGPKRWADIWSAGHSVAAVHQIPTVAELVARLQREYDQARAAGL